MFLMFSILCKSFNVVSFHPPPPPPPLPIFENNSKTFNTETLFTIGGKSPQIGEKMIS